MMNETIWCLTEDDIRTVINDRFPSLNERQVEHIVKRARHKFDIPDWYEMVEAFIEARLDEVEGWEDEE